MKRIYVISYFVILFVLSCRQPQQQILYRTNHFQLALSGNGQVTQFTDLRDGKNYIETSDTKFCLLRINKDDTGIASNKVVQQGDTLIFSFPGSPVTVKLHVTVEKSFIMFDVAGISGGDFYSLQFARVPLVIDYAVNDFAACAMSRKINTRTIDYPGKSNLPGGICFHALGYEGAGIMLLGMPETILRETMKQVVDSYQPGAMPVSHAGGPYAMDDARNYGSYFITYEPVTEEQVEEWVSYLAAFGANQLYFHQGKTFRQGDFLFNETCYPNGIADFRKVSEAFRKHGIITGLLTYDKFIPGDSKYVTPIPSKDLDVMRTFTLAEDLGTSESTIPVIESTADVSVITGFFVHNSKVIRIDDELIIFEKPHLTGPSGFSSCKRGAYGTNVSKHQKGAPVEHLTQFYHLFAPKNGSELFFEIARETARTYNEGGFGLIYLDASDGSFVLAEDKELSWYYESLFVNEILKHTATPPSLEYCWLSNHLWYGISRVGTWDCSTRGHKRFFDLHILANQATGDRLYLPAQMGWTSLCPSFGDNTDHFQYHVFFREDVEYLGAKMIAYNYGASYLDFLSGKSKRPFSYQNGAILKDYDLLRRCGYFSNETRQRLRDFNTHFLLHHSGDDWRLTEANYVHVLLRPGENDFSYHNPFREQTPMIRIEHRHQPVAYDTSLGIDLLPFSENEPVKPENSREFEQPVDLTGHLGLGLWVQGDGGGQNITIRMESPFHLTSGFIDRKLIVDFTGWRYITLVEADNGTMNEITDYPTDSYNHHLYEEFRQTVHFDHISKVTMYIHGDTTNLRFRTLRALPLATSQLVNPAIHANGQTITFRGEIKNGHFMEYMPDGRAIVYDMAGNEVSEMQTDTPSFTLLAGENKIRFSGTAESKQNVNVRITLRTNDNKPFN